MAIACLSLTSALTSMFMLTETLPKLVHKRYVRMAAQEPAVLDSSPGRGTASYRLIMLIVLSRCSRFGNRGPVHM